MKRPKPTKHDRLHEVLRLLGMGAISLSVYHDYMRASGLTERDVDEYIHAAATNTLALTKGAKVKVK